MRTAYSVGTVRGAERELMGRLPEGALMQRAAAGLAAAAADLLGRVYGARVTLLVGSGDNGGDALYAGARLARRGAGVTAVLLAPDRTHPAGLAALRAAGGRAIPATGRAIPGTPGGASSETSGGAISGSGRAVPGTPGGAVPGSTGGVVPETPGGASRPAGARTGPREGASGSSGGGSPSGGQLRTAPGPTGVEDAARDAERALARADLVVDGIVGIGGRGGLRPEAEWLACVARDGRAVVLAVDLPSGVDADTGEVQGPAIRADATVTFGAYKPGLLVDPAAEHTGALRLVDIGLDPYLPGTPDVEALQHADVAERLPVPSAESDKYRRGVVGVVAGSARYPGAAVLAVAGALHGGAGAVRYVGPAADAVIARFPETLVHAGPPAKAGRVQAWVIGPGLGDSADARRSLEDVLASDVPVLVDADGLRLLDRTRVRARRAPTVLTPHAGEAAALLGVERGEVESARLAAVRRLAAEYGATALLKGSTTLVAPAPGQAGPVRVNPTGTGWLATAGSGDVLSGLGGALLAAGLEARDAASVAAYVHGLAGRFAAGRDGGPVGASDVAAALAPAWRDITSATG
ncbi:NAD(P)H-hydrate dehydratase [Streptomyces pathocidini]|uniref:NAD(P)H-hydrate dehydratase n=1 Tax=Streptomyces pathocidini TaxID=1650571 RepID=UPI0033F7F7A6